MRKVVEALRLAFDQNRSQREIATILALSQATVHGYVERFRATGLAWPLPAELDEAALEAQPPMPSLVVLPFVNQSADADNEYFVDGLTEEIIAELSRLRELRVISRNSAMTLKGTRKDTGTIARELEVTHVVTGSVRRAARDRRAGERQPERVHLERSVQRHNGRRLRDTGRNGAQDRFCARGAAGSPYDARGRRAAHQGRGGL